MSVRAIVLALLAALFLAACSIQSPSISSPATPASGPAAGGGVASTAQRPPAGTIQARVSRVVDGDTIIAEIPGRGEERVRYIGIDTPESVDPRRPKEYYGDEASAKNRELVQGKPVWLEKDASDTDQFGRLLRYVYLADGTMVNEELVRLGYTQARSYPPDVKHQERLKAAEREARAAARGLWAPVEVYPLKPPAPVPGR